MDAGDRWSTVRRLSRRGRPLEASLRPHAWWILSLYLLVPYLFKSSLQPFSPVDLTVLLALPASVVGGGWLFANRNELTRMQRIALGLWAALSALVVVGILWASDSSIAVRSAAYFVLLAGLPLLAAFPVGADVRQVRALLLTFVAVGLALVVAEAWSLPNPESGMVDLLGVNRLKVARAALFVPLIGIPLLAWRRGGWVRWSIVALSGFSVFVALGTESRGAPLAFAVVGLVLFIGASIWSGRSMRAIALAGGTLAAILLLGIGLNHVVPQGGALLRFERLLDAVRAVEAEEGEDPLIAVPSYPAGTPPHERIDLPPHAAEVGGRSVVRRGAVFALAWLVFLDQPLLGAGTGGFEAAAERDARFEAFDYPHNLALHVGADFGGLGLLLLAGFGGATVAVWRPTSVLSIALGALLAFLLANAMLSNGLYENRMMWGIWLVTLAFTTGRPQSPDAVAYTSK